MSTINIISFLNLDSLEDLKILYINFVNLFSYKNTIIVLSIILFSVSIILLANKADKIIKNIGQIGTGVLSGVGAVDSSLNLYDRFRGGGSDTNNTDNDKDKDNKKDNKEDENKNDNKNDDKK